MRAIPADEVFADIMTSEQLGESERRAHALRDEYRTMQQLRKDLELTQAEVAARLGKNQVSIAQLERRIDPKISTLRDYIEAMGGELELVVRFPDRPPVVLVIPEPAEEDLRSSDLDLSGPGDAAAE